MAEEGKWEQRHGSESPETQSQCNQSPEDTKQICGSLPGYITVPLVAYQIPYFEAITDQKKNGGGGAGKNYQRLTILH